MADSWNVAGCLGDTDNAQLISLQLFNHISILESLARRQFLIYWSL